MAGELFLVATPIGNLEDMTFRAVRCLKEADLIAAEDTRNTRKLLAHFAIHVPMLSYHEHNKALKGPQLLAKLREGLKIAVVSDAGLPGICDPGSQLVELAVKEGIKVTPVPGANAALTGLIASGLDTRQFFFAGFLPKTKSKREEFLKGLSRREETVIFYETPHHLKRTLEELHEFFGPLRRAVVCRELTKKFEEFLRDDLKGLSAYFASYEARGEMVIILEGNTQIESEDEMPIKSPAECVASFIEQGMDKKAAIKAAAAKLNLPKREVYQAVLKERE